MYMAPAHANIPESLKQNSSLQLSLSPILHRRVVLISVPILMSNLLQVMNAVLQSLTC